MISKVFESRQWLISLFLVIAIFAMGIFLFFRFNRDLQTTRESSHTEGKVTKQVSSQLDPLEKNNTRNTPFNLRQPAYFFSLNDLNGNTLTLLDISGTPIMVNFWATWCLPCRAEMPLFQDFAEKYNGDFVVLAVNTGEDENMVKNIVNYQSLDGLVFLLDPKNDLARLYLIPGFPTSFFIDSEGLLQGFHID